MKRKLLSLMAIGTLVVGSINVNAQCFLATDSVTGGNNATEHSNYIYNVSDQIIKVEKTDSNQVIVNGYDKF